MIENIFFHHGIDTDSSIDDIISIGTGKKSQLFRCTWLPCGIAPSFSDRGVNRKQFFLSVTGGLEEEELGEETGEGDTIKIVEVELMRDEGKCVVEECDPVMIIGIDAILIDEHPQIFGGGVLFGCEVYVLDHQMQLFIII